jgi:dienelactone hydrolase
LFKQLRGADSGEPTGKLIKVADKYDAYIATPPSDKAHTGAGILFIPDVISIWQNSKLMADQFAANGYFCMIIDEFNGDPLTLNRHAGFDFHKWVAEGSDGKNPHTKEGCDPIILAAIKSMKEEYGITKLGAVGYCFGAKVQLRTKWWRLSNVKVGC